MLDPMNDDDFRRISLYSFRHHVAGIVRRTGRDQAEVEAELGGPATSRSENDLWFMIREAGVDVGYLWIRLAPRTQRAYCMDIHLLEAARGKGIGRRAMAAAIDMLAGMGSTALDLSVRRDNAIARRLYRSLGFDPIASDPAHPDIRLTRPLP